MEYKKGNRFKHKDSDTVYVFIDDNLNFTTVGGEYNHNKYNGYPLVNMNRYFSEGTWLEVKINNDMKDFKVGDKVHYIDPKLNESVYYGEVDKFRTIDRIDGEKLYFTGCGWDRAHMMKLYEDRKIIGYNLKDINNREAFLAILNADGNKWSIIGRDVAAKADLLQPQNIEKIKKVGLLDLWFEPVYEDPKPTEIIVETSNETVLVTAKELIIEGEEPVSMAEALKIFQMIKAFNTKVDSYTVAIKSFSVGCKTFTINDIELLEYAITKL